MTDAHPPPQASGMAQPLAHTREVIHLTNCLDDMAVNPPTQTRSETAEVSPPLLLLTTPQAAAALNVSRRTLCELLATGQIASVKIGKCRRFRPEDLQSFVAQNLRKAIGLKGGRA